MVSTRKLRMVLVVVVSVALFACSVGAWPEVYPSLGNSTVDWVFRNTTGATVNVLRLEFEEEVTLDYAVIIGGDLELGGMALMGPLTGRVFDFMGALVTNGAIQINVALGIQPALAQWIKMDAMGNMMPVGIPFFTSVSVLGRLFGQGIVAAREADPEGLMAAFNQFFESNEEYLGEASQAIGVSLVDSLMPIIMASPAEGIENFFNTIMGMLGVTSLSDVTEGPVDFSALFALLGM